MEKKISVIVPVYNVEKYLSQCVGSILGQTYHNIEVILVDDGSSDGSSEMCDRFALDDNRVKVIHKINGGLSDARNVGLKEATGEYVIFVDSDDFWKDKKTLECIDGYLLKRDSKIDFINFNCIYYYQLDEKFKPWPLFPDIVTQGTSRDEIIQGLISHGMFPMSACMKIIRRDFLIENDIYFIKGIVSEDIPWFLELLFKSKKFRFVNEYLYIYRKQVAGTISSSFSEQKYRDLFNIIKQEIPKIDQACSNYDTKNALMSFIAYEYCILLGQVNNFEKRILKQELSKLEEYKWLLKYDLNPKVKLVKRVRRILGLYLTSCLLSFYIKKFVDRN